ncbi:Formin-G [Diplonema papillatum]|nr:Formin-G [Diplonema papillatum]
MAAAADMTPRSAIDALAAVEPATRAQMNALFSLKSRIDKDADFAEGLVEEGALITLLDLMKTAGPATGSFLDTISGLLIYLNGLQQILVQPDIIERIWTIMATEKDIRITRPAVQILIITVKFLGQLQSDAGPAWAQEEGKKKSDPGRKIVHRATKKLLKNENIDCYASLGKLLDSAEVQLQTNVMGLLNIMLQRTCDEDKYKAKKMLFKWTKVKLLDKILAVNSLDPTLKRLVDTFKETIKGIHIPECWMVATKEESVFQKEKSAYDQINGEVFLFEQQNGKLREARSALKKYQDTANSLALQFGLSPNYHPTKRFSAGGGIQMPGPATKPLQVRNPLNLKELADVRAKVFRNYTSAPDFANHVQRIVGPVPAQQAEERDRDAPDRAGDSGFVPDEDEASDDDIAPPSDDDEDMPPSSSEDTPPPSDDDSVPPPSDDEDGAAPEDSARAQQQAAAAAAAASSGPGGAPGQPGAASGTPPAAGTAVPPPAPPVPGGGPAPPPAPGAPPAPPPGAPGGPPPPVRRVPPKPPGKTGVKGPQVQWWKGGKPSQPLRVFHWDKVVVADEQASGTMWNTVHHGIDCTFDLDEFVTKFQAKKKVTGAGHGSGAPVVKKTEMMDAKKFQNISIMLHKMPEIDSIKAALDSLDISILSRDCLEAIKAQIPNSDEQAMFESKIDEKNSKSEAWEKPELYYKMIIDYNSGIFRKRAESWLFSLDWPEITTNIEKPLAKLQTAIDAVLDAQSLPYVMGVLLGFGNMMNAGTNKGNAGAFAPKTLTQLEAARDRSGKINLLQHLVHTVKKEREPALALPVELKSTEGNILSIKYDDLDKAIKDAQDALKKFMTQYKAVMSHIEKTGNTQDPYGAKMSSFKETADVELTRLENEYSTIKEKFIRVLKMWSAPKKVLDKPQPDEFFGCLVPFLERFRCEKEAIEKEQAKVKKHASGQRLPSTNPNENINDIVGNIQEGIVAS